MQGATPELKAAVEHAYAALNAGDLDAFLDRADENVEFTSIVAEAEGVTFRGHEGVREWWESVRGAFEMVSWDLLEVRGDNSRGVAKVRMAGTLGGIPVEQVMWQAVRLRDAHRAVWWGLFRTEREALDSIGLER
jgi:ketosteroid isomerase-like protein